jgi:DNA-binding transcriptional LysR family regulator
MDWDDLRFVLALSRERTLNAAGAALGVRHTTVGRRIRSAEATLGVKLFDRTPEGFLATAAGEVLARAASEMERHALEALTRVRGQDLTLHGPLVVSTMDITYAFCADAFDDFIAQHPDVALTVRTTTRTVSMSRREADVVLRMSNEPPAYLVGRKVGRVAFAPYGSRQLVAERGTSLSDLPWVHWATRERQDWLDQWLAANAPGARIALRVDELAVMRDAVSRGVGVHFLPCAFGDREPDLQRVADPVPEFAQDLWLLTLPELRANARVRAFLGHMGAFLKTRLAVS